MPTRLASPQVAVLLALGLIATLAAPALPASAQEDYSPPAHSVVTEVVNHRFGDGSPGNLGYEVSTEVLEPMAPGDPFPTVRIDDRDHPNAFEGQWADTGFHAAWVSPAGTSQFMPDPFSIESAYLDNYIDGNAPLVPGDRFDMAVKHLPFDAPLTWDRERGRADGELEWDVATRVHRVAGTYGGHSSEMEVTFVRADLVARGGDVDARDASIEAPPLVIDLPRSYGADATVGAVSAQFTPYLHYLRNLDGQVLGQAGKAVFTADMTGYLPQAKEYEMPGGAAIREWHIPLDIIITAVGRTGEVGGRTAMSLPTDGLVKTFGALGEGSLRVAGGSTVVTGAGIAPQVSAADEQSPQSAMAGPGGGGLLDEIEQLAPIDRSLAQPTTVRSAKRSMDVTIDPDLFGSGTLGITKARHLRSGRDFFAATATPSVEVNGTSIPLDRSRLVELRAIPIWDGIRIRFTARTDGNALLDPSSYSRAREGRINEAGLIIEAVYQLGDGLYAFVTARTLEEGSDSSQFDTGVTIRSLSGEPQALRSTQYMETSGTGPFTYDGAPVTNEFSGPTRAIVGDRIAYGGNASGGGVVTVKRASGTSLPPVNADPQVAVAGERLGIYITSAQGRVGDYYGAYLSAGMSGVGTSAGYQIPPIGESCTDPSIVDDAAADASESLDIQRAWFDYDGASVYATLQLDRLDETVLAPSRYRVGWRLDHIGYGLQAARDATGAWKFDLGLHPSARAQWNRIADATGEVVYGAPGYIRIKAPARTTLAAPFLDGEMFRDTGAVSYSTTALGDGIADRAPAGAPDVGYGRGADWTIAPCPGLEVPTTLEWLDAPHEVQTTDEITLRARLADASGPVGDEVVVVSFAGAAQEVVTDASGIAEATFTASVEPGTHAATATFAGTEKRPSAEAATDVTVLREDTALAVTTTGAGVKRRVTAVLTDADTVAGGIAGRTIRFFVDGQELGTAVTDAAGSASFDVPPRYRGGSHEFRALFDGDVWFLPSSSAGSP